MLKLVKALDLQHWADTKESEALMPELMRRLVHASLKEITYVSFPNEDNVYMPGFDGVLEVNQSNPYVSTGLSERLYALRHPYQYMAYTTMNIHLSRYH